MTDYERFPYNHFRVIENCKKMTNTNREASINVLCTDFCCGVAPIVIYSPRIKIADHTGQLELMIINDETGKKIFCAEARELRITRLSDDEKYRAKCKK